MVIYVIIYNFETSNKHLISSKMKTVKYSNRISVSFQVSNTVSNQINEIVKKYNAQSGLYDNSIGGSVLSHDRQSWIKKGQTVGGSIVFHSHSCDIEKGAKDLINLLESNGLKNETFQEVLRTHRSDGIAYKMPQPQIVKT